jgi:protein involved in polysaccharide export with SLBB domain
MFKIDTDKTIRITRGDMAMFEVSAIDEKTGQPYMFKVGDVVRFKVYEKKDYGSALLIKDTVVSEETTVVDVHLESKDTKIGELVNKPKEHWYEVEVNPETAPQTIICHDEYGPKVFMLYPEGSDMIEY